jgi:alkylation response protein AidB-like acyl-CoA dehydrogenase
VNSANIDDFCAVIRRAGREHIEDLAVEIDRSQKFSPELWDLIRSLGIPSIAFSAESGGGGGSYLAYVMAIEELARAGAVAAVYCGPTVQVASAILRFGTRGQSEQWATRLVQSQAMGAWAFTEPATGSDPKQLRTVATRDRETWVLNGGKTFISFAGYADIALVFAKTSSEALGAFLVDTANPGWQPGNPIKMLAFGGMGTSPVAIVDLTVPADALLGRIDGGFEILIATEAEAKIRAGAICVGIGRRALEEAVRYASLRTHRGLPIGEKFSTVQALIGNMSAEVDAAKSLVYSAALAVDAHTPEVPRLAASVRIVCARMAREVTSDAMQVCGAYGFTHEMVLERLYREGKFYDVGQGVIELQKLIVGKVRLREYRSTLI